jgi:hypothetical protein
MTKLVPVRVVCDDCRTAEARVYCVSLRRALCTACSESQQPHSRLVDLASTVTALPFCQRCDDAPASTYCAARGHTLCHNCDEADCSAARSQGSGKRDIVTALTQRSVRFTSSRPTTSSSATPPLSLERPEPMPPGTEVGGPLRRRAAEQAAAMNAGNAQYSVADSAGAQDLPHEWPHDLRLGAGFDAFAVAQTADRCGLSQQQYLYIAHCQQQLLIQQMYRQQAVLPLDSSSNALAMHQQQHSGLNQFCPSDATAFGVNGKRGRCHLLEDRVTGRQVAPRGDFGAFERNGSGEGSSGSDGNSGAGSDGNAGSGSDGLVASANGSGSSRRSDVAVPFGVPNSAAVAAAAVAAAGERYLLSSTQCDAAHGSSGMQPLDVDPAGLVTAATVAAAGVSAAIATNAAAANAAAMAAGYGSFSKRERDPQSPWDQVRTKSDGRVHRAGTPGAGGSEWDFTSGNGSGRGSSVDIASSQFTHVDPSIERESNSSYAVDPLQKPGSIVGSSVIGAGSLGDGMPDGFEDNLDFSQFEQQQAPSSRTLSRSGSNVPGSPGDE